MKIAEVKLIDNLIVVRYEGSNTWYILTDGHHASFNGKGMNEKETENDSHAEKRLS